MAVPVVRQTVTVGQGDPVGLHLRPAQLFVQLASRFQADVKVVRETQRVDGKSIFDMMTLAAVPGTPLEIEATGDDAEHAVAALVRFIENDFVVDETQKAPAQPAQGDPGSTGPGAKD